MNFRRLLVPIAGIGLLGFVVLFVLSSRNNTAATPQVEEPKTPVVVAKFAIPQGGEITFDALETKQFTKAELDSTVPVDALRDGDKLVGGTARVAIAAGDFFTPTNTAPLPTEFSGMIDAGQVAVTFHAPPEPSLYDLRFLNPGDYVDVFGVHVDQGTGDTVSVRLASNVKLLAVDKVKSQAEEEYRKEKLRQEVAALNQQLQAKQAQTTPPPSTEELDGLRKQIADTQAKIEPEVEEEQQSLTIQVTPAQSQKIALWRQSADITVALHREGDDPETVIFEGAMASVDGLPTGQPGAPLVAGTAPTGQILTMDDVVPLDRRDPAKYYQEQQAAEQHRTMVAGRRLSDLETQANEIETQNEIRNLLRFGTRQQPLPAPSFTPGLAAPTFGSGGGLTKQDLNEAMGGVNRRLKDVEDKLASKSGTTAQPKPLRGSVEIYRGKDKTVEHY